MQIQLVKMASKLGRGLRYDEVSLIELTILLALAAGYSNQELADELNLSPLTVKSHLARLSQRFSASSRTALANLAKDSGWPVSPLTIGAANITTREREVIELASLGKTNIEIGYDMGISPQTVKIHLRRIFSKLDISSRAELVRYATTSGQ